MGQKVSLIFGFLLLAVIISSAYFAISLAWDAITSVDDKLALAILAGFFGLVGSAVTISLGKYFERKREIEAHFREKKIAIYDEFLKEFFKLFNSVADGAAPETDEDVGPSDPLVVFLREWQRTLVLWGGRDVLRTYFAWINSLRACLRRGIPLGNRV